MGASIKRICATALTLAVFLQPALAETHFITLGTSGGPNARMDRSQPANLLVVNGVKTLVDAGDGVAGRLAGAHVPVWAVDNLLISHMHFDHMGGLYAILGLRFQLNPKAPLQVYGPPGTKLMIDKMLEAMGPAMKAAYGVPNAKIMKPEELVIAHEVQDGDTFTLGDTKVTAVKNTHYSFPPGSAMDKEFQSLSFRFDTPDESIVYTGDTGRSDAVTKLATGADLLVSEMIDLDAVLNEIKRSRPNLPEAQTKEIRFHLSTHHLSPEELGKMAAKAKVGAVVATHLVGGAEITDQDAETWKAAIAKQYGGKITIAKDLEQF
jgi:ribonuclease BN (tRNA processing enzyme)